MDALSYVFGHGYTSTPKKDVTEVASFLFLNRFHKRRKEKIKPFKIVSNFSSYFNNNFYVVI